MMASTASTRWESIAEHLVWKRELRLMAAPVTVLLILMRGQYRTPELPGQRILREIKAIVCGRAL